MRLGYEEHKRQAAERKVRCAVLTISDTRTEEVDESGKVIIAELSSKGHTVSCYRIVRNDREPIRKILRELLEDEGTDAVFTTGGTGIGRRDITVEVVEEIAEKKLDGFGEIFRALSYKEIGSGAIMSRAMMGVVRGKVIVCMPGSSKAVMLAMGLLMPELGHILWEANR
jgi:molybdenum cofactor biosynthesis protein B